MSTTIIKPDPNQDWYCVWESIVDNWIYAGTRAELEAACPQHAEGERFDRADATGSSALWGDGEPIYSWASEDRTLTVRNFAGELSDASAILHIDKLRAWCESGADALTLLEWEEWE